MSRKDWLTKPQKYQIFTVGGILALEILAYTILGLLNGFPYLNTWMRAHIVAVMFFATLPFSLIPSYSALDDIWTKLLKQFTLFGVLVIFSSAITWGHYQFNPPSTGFGRIAERLSLMIGLFGIVDILVLPGVKRKADQ